LLAFCFPSKVLWWPVDSAPMVIFCANIGLGVQPFITLGYPLALYCWQQVRTCNSQHVLAHLRLCTKNATPSHRYASSRCCDHLRGVLTVKQRPPMSQR
jgi:hypothetical protein